jgi:hypothetical protein
MHRRNKMAKKVKVQDAKVIPGRGPKAVKAGPAGKQQNADGTNHSTPNPHHSTEGSDNK